MTVDWFDEAEVNRIAMETKNAKQAEEARQATDATDEAAVAAFVLEGLTAFGNAAKRRTLRTTLREPSSRFSPPVGESWLLAYQKNDAADARPTELWLDVNGRCWSGELNLSGAEMSRLLAKLCGFDKNKIRRVLTSALAGAPTLLP